MRFAQLMPLFVLFGTACGSTIKTRVLSELKPGQEFDGVIYYLPTYVYLRYTYTAAVDTAGKPIKCSPVVFKEEVSLVADQATPVVTSVANGLFRFTKLSMSFNQGLLTQVNAEPVQQVADVVSAVTTLAKVAGTVAPAGFLKQGSLPNCNAAPVVRASRVLQEKPGGEGAHSQVDQELDGRPSASGAPRR